MSLEITDRERGIMQDSLLVQDYLDRVIKRNRELVEYAAKKERELRKLEKRVKSLTKKLAYRRKFPTLFLMLDFLDPNVPFRRSPNASAQRMAR